MCMFLREWHCYEEGGIGICYHYSIFIEYLSVHGCPPCLGRKYGSRKRAKQQAFDNCPPLSTPLPPSPTLVAEVPVAIMQKKIVFVVQSGNKMQVFPQRAKNRPSSFKGKDFLFFRFAVFLNSKVISSE